MMALGIHLLSVLVLALVVEIACRLGRFRPALCHALWLVVLLKLVVPPMVAWPWEGGDVMAYFQPSSVEANLPVGATEESVAQLSFSDAVLDGARVSSMDEQAPDTHGWFNGRTAGYGGLSLWFLGALMVLGRLIWQAQRARRVVASGIAPPVWLQTQLRETCAALNVTEPRAIVGEAGCGGVYVHFLGRPILVISDDALEHIEASQWPTILTHEMAHLKRRDHWVAWLMLAAGVLWWWNPCLWWVRHRIHLHSELACDAWVVNTHPGERKNYAETMVRILTLLSERAEPAPAMGLAVWSSATQERRLWMVMKGKGASNVGCFYAVGLVALAVMLTPAWFAVAEQEEAVGEKVAESAEKTGWQFSTKPAEGLDEVLALTVDLEFEDVHLKFLAEYIGDRYGVNLVVDQRAVLAESEADEARGGAQPEGGTDGLISFVNLKAAALGGSLKAICRPLGLTVDYRSNTIWLTSAELLEMDRALSPPSAVFDESELLHTLETEPVNIEFEDIHIKNLLGFFEKAYKVNIVVDERAVMPEGGDWDSPPTGSPGYATDGMIRYINLKDLPVAEVLYVATRMLNLSYVVEENRVFVSTPALLHKRR